MCESGAEMSAVWVRDVRRARREHTCSACHRTIARGHAYAITRSLFEGRWDQFKHCGRCDRIYLALVDRLDYDVWVDPRLACGTEWRDAFYGDPPPDIAALAFVTEAEASALLDGGES